MKPGLSHAKTTRRKTACAMSRGPVPERERRGPKTPPSFQPVRLPHSAAAAAVVLPVADWMSTVTPGPMVEDSEIFFM